ncbi:MAG: F0F1 ATP synthase subunit B [Chloroflexi bacterium]|nr:F0F1 ATP synthase subunit B [Chloroflexota bacterium]
MEQLGINLPGLVAQIVNFGLLLLLLRLVAYKPILGMLDQRAARIRESMERAEEIRRQAQRAEAEFAERLNEARREGQAIVTRANEAAVRIQREAEERARAEAEEFLRKARTEIDRDRQRAIAELRAQVADLTVLAASRVIGRALDKPAHLAIIEETIQQAEKAKLS